MCLGQSPTKDFSPVRGEGLKGAFSDPLIRGKSALEKSSVTTEMHGGFTITFRQVLPVPSAQTLLEGKDIVTFTAHPSAFTSQTGMTQHPDAPKS